MDKVISILALLKKHLFWFISGATIIVILVCWWMSTASLAKSFQLQQAEIKKKIGEVESIVGDTQHPTPEYIKAVNDKNQKLKEGVLAVWMTLYNEQKEKNPWPAVLGENFINEVTMKLGPTDTIPYNLRERYQNVIKDYFPILYDSIKLRRPADEVEGGARSGENAAVAPRTGRTNRIGQAPGGRRGPVDTSDLVGVVDWDVLDRDRLENNFDWKTRPDSDLIRLRQEDLWVYNTLLRVISETNSEMVIQKDKNGNNVKDKKGNNVTEVVYIKEHAQASIKRIEWIEIGADAIKAWSEADQSVFRAKIQEAAPAGRGEALPDARTAAAGRDTAGQNPKELLLKDRYVDDKGTPLDAEAKHPYAEFKMMPISMKLDMDQRKISKLLVECANSPMPIEVRRVRIRPGEGGILDAGAMDTPGPTKTGRGETLRRSVGARAPVRAAAGGRGSEESELGPYDISVEVQGIIYIYNPPDLSTLGTGTAAEKPLEGAPAAEGGAGAPDKTPPADAPINRL